MKQRILALSLCGILCLTTLCGCGMVAVLQKLPPKPATQEEEVPEPVEPVLPLPENRYRVEDVLFAPVVRHLCGLFPVHYYRLNDCDQDGASELILEMEEHTSPLGQSYVLVDQESAALQMETATGAAQSMAYCYDPSQEKVLLRDQYSTDYAADRYKAWNGQEWATESAWVREQGVVTTCEVLGGTTDETAFETYKNQLEPVSALPEDDLLNVTIYGDPQEILHQFRQAANGPHMDFVELERDINQDGLQDVVFLCPYEPKSWYANMVLPEMFGGWDNLALLPKIINHFVVVATTLENGVLFQTDTLELWNGGDRPNLSYDDGLVIETTLRRETYRIDPENTLEHSMLSLKKSEPNFRTGIGVMGAGAWVYNGVAVGDTMDYDFHFVGQDRWYTVSEQSNGGQVITNTYPLSSTTNEELDKNQEILVNVDFTTMEPSDTPTTLTWEVVDGTCILSGDGVVLLCDDGSGTSDLTPPYSTESFRKPSEDRVWKEVGNATIMVGLINGCGENVNIFMDEPFPDTEFYRVDFGTSATAFVWNGGLAGIVEYAEGMGQGDDYDWYYIFKAGADGQPGTMVHAVGYHVDTSARRDYLFAHGQVYGWVDDLTTLHLENDHTAPWDEGQKLYDRAVSAYAQMIDRVT